MPAEKSQAPAVAGLKAGLQREAKRGGRHTATQQGLVDKLVAMIDESDEVSAPRLSAIDKLTKLLGLNRKEANFSRLTPEERVEKMLECRQGLEALGIKIWDDMGVLGHDPY